MVSKTQQLINFLQEDLAISADSIPLILQQCGNTPHRLPVVLWQQRLIDWRQLDRVLVWLESYVTAENHCVI